MGPLGEPARRDDLTSDAAAGDTAAGRADTAPRAQRAALWAAALALYAALSLAATWPLARELGSSLPRGSDTSATVPLASAWALWWVSDRVAAGFESFWDAPIFFPTAQTFAFSEPLLLEGAVAAPLLWAGASPVLAHNLVLLAALATNGGFAFALLRGLGLAPLAAGAGGAMSLLLPYVHHELGVLTLVPLAGVLAVLHALLAFSRRATPWRGVRLGLAFAATYLLCGQYGLFLALVGAPAALCLVQRALLVPRSLLALALAVATACALLAPVVSAQLEVRRAHGFARSEHSSALGAAGAGSFALTPTAPWVPFPGIHAAADPSQQALFPGTLKLALAIAGLAWGLRRRDTRRFTAFLAVLAVASVLLAALPRVEVFGIGFFHALQGAVPGLAQVRSFWRASMLMQLAIALLAAAGIEALAVAARRPAQSVWRRAASLAVVCLALVAPLELWPPAPGLSATPLRETWRPWLDWIAEHVPPAAPLVHLPVPASERVGDYEETARNMLLATAHAHPLMNGYSSYFPRPYRAFARIMRGCPTPAAWSLLRELGLRVLVVRSSWLAPDSSCGPAEALYRRSVRFEALDVELWEAAGVSASSPGGIPGAP